MSDELMGELLAELGARGCEQAEVYLKRGRSRRFEIGAQGRIAAFSREEGWAVRAGDRRASFFAAGAGTARPGTAWPDPDGRPLRLPAPAPPAPWKGAPDLEAPLVVEREAIALLEGFERELQRELPGSVLLRGVLEDGTSEAELASSRGVRTSLRHRVSTLLLELRGPESGLPSQRLLVAERQPGRFNPVALAQRAATRWMVSAGGESGGRERGEMLLAPALAVALLEGLLPLLVGPARSRVWAAWRDRQGRVGSPRLSVLDDGRLSGGALDAPVDGEGTPTRRVRLIEEGVFVQPLLAWWQEHSPPARASGCVRRASWRDLPRPGPTHLFIRPEPAVSVASLLGSVTRGFYLIDAAGAGRFDLEGNRFSLPVCGFALERGSAAAPVAGVRLCGSLGALLRGIQGVARDLEWFPRDGMLGSPSLLVSGLELQDEAGR